MSLRTIGRGATALFAFVSVASTLLVGCSVLFNGDKHRGVGGADGGVDGGVDAGARDAGEPVVCEDHGDCALDPFSSICGPPNPDGVRFCQASCTDGADCVGHPSGRLCIAEDNLCGCDADVDCPAAAPRCPPAPGSSCVQCLVNGHCALGENCVDNACITPCVNDDSCPGEDLCRFGQCVPMACDADGDGFLVEGTSGCPAIGPFDCIDTDPLVFPGALPDCSTPELEACPGGPLATLFPAPAPGEPRPEVGASVDAPVVLGNSGGPMDYGLDVVIEPMGERVARVSYHPRGTPSRTVRLVKVDEDGVALSGPAVVGQLMSWTQVESYDMARAVNGEIVAAAIGVGPMAMDELQLFDDAGPIVPARHSIMMGQIRGVVAVAGADAGDTRGLFREGAGVRLLASDGTVSTATLTGHGASPWLAQAGGVAIGSMNDSHFLWPFNVSTTAGVIAGTIDDGRGDVTQIDDGTFVGVVRQSSGYAWFTAPPTCSGNNNCQIASGDVRPLEALEVELPAIAPGAPGTAFLVVRERATDPQLVLRDLRPGPMEPRSVVVLDRLGPMARIEDVAMDSYLDASQLDVVIVAIVERPSSPAELRTVRVRACLPP